MGIADLIPVGKENAISREFLVALCVRHGLVDGNRKPETRDRAMRSLLEKEREKGEVLIMNLSDGKGYYMPGKEDLPDVKRYIRQEENRAKATFRNLRFARKLYEDYKSGRL